MPQTIPPPPEPMPTLQLAYLPYAEQGAPSGLSFEVPETLLGHWDLWVRSRETDPFVPLREARESLKTTWYGDLITLEALAHRRGTRRWYRTREFLRREPPGSQVQIRAYDGAVTWVAGESPTSHWRTSNLPDQLEDWQAIEPPVAQLSLDNGTRHGLLPLPLGHHHVAVSLTSVLTLGRLHLGPDRDLNQSESGAHWHLGWRHRNAHRGAPNPDALALARRSRDWLSRKTVSLHLTQADEGFGLRSEAHNPEDQLRLERRDENSWCLEIRWETCQEDLVIHVEEASFEVGGRPVRRPWFWAERRGLEPGLEDRTYLWLPGWEPGSSTTPEEGGWLGQAVRWHLEGPRLVISDAAPLLQPRA